MIFQGGGPGLRFPPLDPCMPVFFINVMFLLFHHVRSEVAHLLERQTGDRMVASSRIQKG